MKPRSTFYKQSETKFSFTSQSSWVSLCTDCGTQKGGQCGRSRVESGRRGDRRERRGESPHAMMASLEHSGGSDLMWAGFLKRLLWVLLRDELEKEERGWHRDQAGGDWNSPGERTVAHPGAGQQRWQEIYYFLLETEQVVVRLAAMREEREESRLGSGRPGGHPRQTQPQWISSEVGEHEVSKPLHVIKSEVPFGTIKQWLLLLKTVVAYISDLPEGNQGARGLKLGHWKTCVLSYLWGRKRVC